MKTIADSAREKTLNDLLKKARRGTVVLESADGQRFVLTAVNGKASTLEGAMTSPTKSNERGATRS